LAPKDPNTLPQVSVNHIRILFCGIGASILGLTAYMDYAASSLLLSVATLALALVLLINGINMYFSKQEYVHHHVDALFLILLASFSLFASDVKGEHSYWLYFYPIAAFFLFPLRTAIWCVLAYTPLAAYIIFQYSPPLLQGQICFSYAAIATVALFLAMVKSRTNQLLEPLISSDAETGAQLEKFLRPALKTEINRAEREGTGLLLVYIKHQASSQKGEKTAQLIKQCAQAIAQYLRPFDQYYRLQKDSFAIIMPHANSQDALVTVKEMITHMPTVMQSTIQVGFASLNVDDTEDTLIEQALKGLRHV